MLKPAPVGPDNRRLGLHVRDDQKTFMASSAGILARAYAYREQRSRAFTHTGEVGGDEIVMEKRLR